MAYKIDGRLVEHFTLAEMCNKEAKEDVKLVITSEVVEFAQMMEKLRKWYNKPMTVNSWFRTANYNRLCGGASNSLHLDGLACDISLPNLTDLQFEHFRDKWKSICEQHKKIGGINRYRWGLHFDCKENKFGYKDFVVRDKR